jgi:hypothetical protein
MDLPLFLSVVWRFRLIVLSGLVVAIALSFLAVFKVHPGRLQHLSYREPQVWADDVTLLVTPQRFPWGGSVFSEGADPAKYGQLATIYANLATSDAVKTIVLRKGPVDFAKEPMLAVAVPYSTQNSSSPPLPLITLEAQAATKERSIELVGRETRAFLEFLEQQQAVNGIPKDKRVEVSVVKGDQIRLLKKRSKTVPILIFMLVTIATLGLAFMLENLRPRHRHLTVEDVMLAPAEVRRSA